MDVPTHDELLDRIAAFCERHGMAESRFGREAVNNPALVTKLRDGSANPTLSTLQALRDFMARKDDELASVPPPATDSEEAA